MSTLNASATTSTSRPQTEKAAIIYEYTVISTNSLWSAFELAKSNRGNPRGITTDQEQDLLRAMLVMAASGLDSTLKQLIRDCIASLIKKSEDVHEPFERFTQRRLQSDDSSPLASAKFLAKVLASPHPQSALIEDYTIELTGDSLQSAEQVLKVIAAFALEQKRIVPDVVKLKEAFRTRNQIIHELDMNLSGAKRKRRVRGQAELKSATELLLATCRHFVEGVDARLGA